jgi:hypothetical protein
MLGHHTGHSPCSSFPHSFREARVADAPRVEAGAYGLVDL